jgi:hypothetical protein
MLEVQDMSSTKLKPVSNVVSSTYETDGIPSQEFFDREVGINEAASITGRGKGQIGRDSNTGRLKYTLNDKEQKRYKVADLYQLYGFKNPKDTSNDLTKIPDEKLKDTTQTDVELAILKERLNAQEKVLQRMESEINDLRQNRDRQLETINKLTLLLPAPQSAITQALSESQQPPVKKSFWQRLFP